MKPIVSWNIATSSHLERRDAGGDILFQIKHRLSFATWSKKVNSSKMSRIKQTILALQQYENEDFVTW